MREARTQGALADDTRRRLDAALTRAATELGALTTDQTAWVPGPGRWSVDECLAHLVATHDAYLPGLVAVTGSAAPRAPASARYRPGWVGRMIGATVDPEGKKRVKTPRAFTPSVARLPGSALDTFLRCYRDLANRIEATEELDWHRIRLPTPVSRLLRLRLGDAYWILAAHAQRHVDQAVRLTQQDGFPGREAAS